MGRIAVVAYRPKAGKTDELRALVQKHLPVLQQEELVTERPSVIMQAADDTIVEVFEWASSEAIEKAHDNPAVVAMWQDFDKVCDYVPIADVAEARSVFSEFTPLN